MRRQTSTLLRGKTRPSTNSSSSSVVAGLRPPHLRTPVPCKLHPGSHAPRVAVLPGEHPLEIRARSGGPTARRHLSPVWPSPRPESGGRRVRSRGPARPRRIPSGCPLAMPRRPPDFATTATSASQPSSARERSRRPTSRRGYPPRPRAFTSRARTQRFHCVHGTGSIGSQPGRGQRILNPARPADKTR